MQVSQLFIFPLKSAAGIALPSIDVEPRGPRDDRRWMLVDAQNRFVSGREIGALVKLSANASERGLALRWGDETLQVEYPADHAERCEVTLWDDQVDAALASDAAATWLSDRLGRPLRLVYMDARSHRPVSTSHVQGEHEVSFADGYPLLLLSAAAVREVDRRAGGGIDARRFRPNIVIEGSEAHEEDRWKRLRIGDIEFLNPKLCVRCVFTTVDPDSGLRDSRGEPLRSLKEYRRSDRGIIFGVNLIALGTGRIQLGDPVQVLEWAGD